MSKRLRHQAIREMVAREPVSSQEHLRELLAAQGHAVTQSTLSRDLKELDLVKGARGYQLPLAGEDSPHHSRQRLEHAVAQYLLRCTAAQNFVVLRTEAGHAHPLAVAIDHCDLAGVLGTIAGDDTVLLLAQDAEAARVASSALLEIAARRP